MKTDYHTEATTGNDIRVEGWPEVRVMVNGVEIPGNWGSVNPETRPWAAGPTLGAEIANEAGLHVGKRYWRGTAGPDTFDCSGFTHYVVKRATGRVLPRSSYEYNRLPEWLAVKVTGRPQAGDIALFDSEGNGSVGHVGIIRSDGMMVNALNEQAGVTVSDPNSPYFRSIYLGAIRVV